MRVRLISAAFLAVGITANAFAASFTQGNIVLVRMGDGTATLGSTGTAVFLDEYTPGGSLVQSIAMPTSGSGSNRQFVNSGSATSEGFLTLSGDSRFLMLGGYDAALGTTGVAATTSATVNRVIARVGFNGVADTTTALTDGFSAGNIRSVYSSDGANIWAAGSNNGVRYATYGASTSVQLNTSAPTNVRVLNAQFGQLYVSAASGTFQGVGTVGTGMPTTAGQTLTLLNGMPTAAGPSSYDYWFADANTLYVADDRASASGGGIQKWIQSAGTWSLQYTLNGQLTTGVRGLTASLSGSNATFYASTTEGSANKLVSITDNITNTTATGNFAVIATAGTNTAFRGVEFTPVPEPASMAVLGLGVLAALRRRKASK